MYRWDNGEKKVFSIYGEKEARSSGKIKNIEETELR